MRDYQPDLESRQATHVCVDEHSRIHEVQLIPCDCISTNCIVPDSVHKRQLADTLSGVKNSVGLVVDRS